MSEPNRDGAAHQISIPWNIIYISVSVANLVMKDVEETAFPNISCVNFYRSHVNDNLEKKCDPHNYLNFYSHHTVEHR